MEFSGTGLLVLLHVLFGALWFGAAAYQVLVVGPAMRAAGPQGTGFVVALIRGGRVGRFYAISGGLAILFGIITFVQEDVGAQGMEGRGLWLSLGAAAAILAFIHGAAVNLPNEKRLAKVVAQLKGAPTAEQGRQMQELGMRMGKNGVISLGLISLAIVLMLMQRVLV